jgi:hypothetical protein
VRGRHGNPGHNAQARQASGLRGLSRQPGLSRPFLRWFFESPDRSAINYDQERAQHVVLQNAKLKVELRQLKRELIPADEVARVGAELGAAIRKVVTRLHRTAPSLEGHPVATIEARLKEEEDDILKQLHTIDERLKPWQQAD